MRQTKKSEIVMIKISHNTNDAATGACVRLRQRKAWDDPERSGDLSIDIERNSVHCEMHLIDAAVGQGGQQHGLRCKAEQAGILCDGFKIG